MGHHSVFPGGGVVDGALNFVAHRENAISGASVAHIFPELAGGALSTFTPTPTSVSLQFDVTGLSFGDLAVYGVSGGATDPDKTTPYGNRFYVGHLYFFTLGQLQNMKFANATATDALAIVEMFTA